MHIRAEPPGYGEFPARKLLVDHGDHPPHVGVSLLERHTWLEPRDGLIAEVPDPDLRAIEAERREHRGFDPQHPEVGRHHADDLPHQSVECQRAANDTGVTREAALPVAVTEHRREGRSPGIVFGTERPAQKRRYAQERERAVRNAYDHHPLGLFQSGHRAVRVVPHPDVLEGLGFVSIGEIRRRCLREVDVPANAGGGVPNAHEVFRILIRKRLQQHTVNHGEHCRGGADAQSNREDGHGREHAVAAERSECDAKVLPERSHD
jgi:hypothetical protein